MARNRYDIARMEGIDAAVLLQRKLNLRERIENSEKGFVDVFEIIEELDIPFNFSELDKALGFCLPHPQRGIVVTTKASLHRQRFTAAHELGHAMLEHEGSIDTEILMRGGQAATSGELIEIEAESFAAELLLPKWLLVHHMRRQGWTVTTHMSNPEIVYQLALRASASFEATCWSLFGNKLLPNRAVLDELIRAGRRLAAVKEVTLTPFEARVGHGNAWRLSSRDNGGRFSSQTTDFLRIDLEENIGGGYVWDLDGLERTGFELKFDGYPETSTDNIGGQSNRRLVLVPPAGHDIELMLSEQRPWLSKLKPSQVFGITLDVLGPEKAGMSRARRVMLGLDPVG
ncbi:MAG: ImmA/IrrE family metallo-endopeptidase [Parasphingorhabdus sp.]